MPNSVKIGPVVLEKDNFKIFRCVNAISLLSSLKMGVVFHLKNLKSLNDALCQIQTDVRITGDQTKEPPLWDFLQYENFS